MANAKLSWWPVETKAITLDEAHYLYASAPLLNLGTSDFTVQALLHLDASMTAQDGAIIGKGFFNLANAAGWYLFVDPANLRLGLRINDGDVVATTVYSNASVYALATWFLAAVTVDRDGLATFYVNGAAAGGGSVAAASGTLNNSESVIVGGFSTGNEIKGAIDFVALRSGLVSAPWFAEEYQRVRYGYPRAVGDWLELWDFENSLSGDSLGTTLLTWGGGGSPSYESGSPYANAPIDLDLTANFAWEYQESFLPADDLGRALDGSAYAYKGCRKRRYTLSFNLIGLAQKTALEAAWVSGAEIDFYKDSGHPATMTCRIIDPPIFSEYFTNMWNGELELEET